MSDDVPRLSAKEAVILDILIAKGETYGLEIVRASEGQVGKGTLYVTLGRMVEKGFLTSQSETQAPGAVGPPRRMYRVTGFGKSVFKARQRFVAATARWGFAGV